MQRNTLTEKTSSPYRERRFATYIESENWKDAVKLWPALPQSFREKTANKAGLLKAHAALNNKKICNQLAVEILKSDPRNITALDWQAKRYFWLAENRYQAELKAYNKNKTRSQYVELLTRISKVVTVHFQKIAGLLQKIIRTTASAESARYMGNIYAR